MLIRSLIKFPTMNKINFNEDKFKNADQKDLMRFFSMVAEDQTFKNNGSIYAGNLTETEDAKNPQMTTVEISFQFFKPKEKGTGRKFVWTSYRAKTHACSNTYIKELI